jgi:hypothetical protein
MVKAATAFGQFGQRSVRTGGWRKIVVAGRRSTLALAMMNSYELGFLEFESYEGA